MSGAAREPDQADFDLERFIEMFDEALTSQDPRVINSLRSLMMIVTLTRPDTSSAGIVDRQQGPLRRLFEDMNHLNRRLGRAEDEIMQIRNQEHRRETAYKEAYKYDYPYEKYTLRAADEMAAQVDQNVLNQLKQQAAAKFGRVPNKGLLDK